MAIWVAVGGRATLFGAVLGAWLVNGGKSWLTAALPSAWLYVLGALFVAVTLFLPDGLVGLSARIKAKLVARANAKTVPDANARITVPNDVATAAVAARPAPPPT
jgi:urea transport system permease protein